MNIIVHCMQNVNDTQINRIAENKTAKKISEKSKSIVNDYILLLPIVLIAILVQKFAVKEA